MDTDSMRLARDIAIECMGRLDDTVFTVRESCGADGEFFLSYRLACAQTMGGVGDIINVVVRSHPELKPSEEEWIAVASRRRDAAPPPAGLQEQALVRAEVDIVVEHMRVLREQDRDGVLARVLDDVDENLPKLMATLEDWEPLRP